MDIFIVCILSAYVYACGALTSNQIFFNVQPRGGSVTEGESHALYCDVSNRTDISFEWTKDAEDIINDERRYVDQGNLYIKRLVHDLDTGNYVCYAVDRNSGAALKSAVAELTVHSLSRNVTVVKEKPVDAKSLKEGGELRLRCKAKGHPTPKITWYHNGAKIFSERFVTQEDTLTFGDVSWRDNGVYSCRATNDAGQARSLTNFLLALNPSHDGSSLQLEEESFRALVLVGKGQDALLPCSYRGAAATEWHHAGVTITSSRPNAGSYHIFQNGTLQVFRVRKGLEGDYKCVGMIPGQHGGSVQMFTSSLVLANLESLTKYNFVPTHDSREGEALVVLQGTTAKVTCFPPKGTPDPRLTWRRSDGATIQSSGRVKSKEGVLSIRNVMLTDSGNYTCVASNGFHTTQAHYRLSVFLHPHITSPPRETRVKEGEDAYLACRHNGTQWPVASVRWQRRHAASWRTVAPDDSYGHYHVYHDNGTLRILGVQKSDGVAYRCQVKIQGYPQLTESPPARLHVRLKLKFTSEPVSEFLRLGHWRRVHCQAEGTGNISYKWYRNGLEQLPRGVTSFKNGSLIFSPAEREHAGVYTCRVSSSLQGNISANVTLDTGVPPVFTSVPHNTTVSEGHDVVLNCQAEGDPTPYSKWDRNGDYNYVFSGNKKVLTNGTLYIVGARASDSGRYGCMVGNKGGMDRREVHVHVIPAHLPRPDSLPGHRHNVTSGEEAEGASDVKDTSSGGMLKTIIIVVCAAVAYIALVVALLIYCRIRRNKISRKHDLSAASADKPEGGTLLSVRQGVRNASPAPPGPPATEASSYAHRPQSDAFSLGSRSSTQPSRSSRGSSRNRLLSEGVPVFPRHALHSLQLLGKGVFGEVFAAQANDISGLSTVTPVVLKTLQSPDESAAADFAREMEMLSRLDHANVVRILGVCRDATPHCIVTEFLAWGDLKQFLMSCTNPSSNGSDVTDPLIASGGSLAIPQQINLARQVAAGLAHLAERRVVHRDVAARNVLLAPDLTCKLCFHSLCVDVNARDYVRHRGRLLPLRWLPPESVLSDQFSHKSDVYMFGVLLWEILSHAEFPHKRKSDEEVLRDLTKGSIRLPLAPHWAPELTSVAQRCWALNAADRPTGAEVTHWLETSALGGQVS